MMLVYPFEEVPYEKDDNAIVSSLVVDDHGCQLLGLFTSPQSAGYGLLDFCGGGADSGFCGHLRCGPC